MQLNQNNPYVLANKLQDDFEFQIGRYDNKQSHEFLKLFAKWAREFYSESLYHYVFTPLREIEFKESPFFSRIDLDLNLDKCKYGKYILIKPLVEMHGLISDTLKLDIDSSNFFSEYKTLEELIRDQMDILSRLEELDNHITVSKAHKISKIYVDDFLKYKFNYTYTKNNVYEKIIHSSERLKKIIEQRNNIYFESEGFLSFLVPEESFLLLVPALDYDLDELMAIPTVGKFRKIVFPSRSNYEIKSNYIKSIISCYVVRNDWVPFIDVQNGEKTRHNMFKDAQDMLFNILFETDLTHQRIRPRIF